jgi:4-hydroxy-tetrahydrodipicolinate synthase
MISFAGSWAALVTPFHDGSIDTKALYTLLDRHLEAQSDGLVICGTTGESATLTATEKADLMQIVAKRVSGKIKLVFGTGGNNTAAVAALTRKAEDLGAQGVLVVTPYYNKPTPAGLIAHFTEVAKATKLPVILYNVPGRTGVNMAPGTALELARLPNVKAMKEASGNLEQVMDLIKGAPPGFEVLSGEDSLNFPIMALGAAGCISVTANVDPRRMKAFTAAALQGDWAKARQVHFELLDLHRAMFIEANPIPVKTALHLMHLIRPEFRLPLVPAQSSTSEKLTPLLERMGLLP